jgi:RNA polymerase sigma factor (sigma-70 family)
MSNALHISDRVLVDRLFAGEIEAADHFVTRFSQLVWAVLVRDFRISQDLRDDLYQDVFLRLWEDDYRRLRLWSGEGSLASYLGPTVRHLAIDRLRTRLPERENPLPESDDHDHPHSNEASQEELTWLEEQRLAVEQAVEALDERDRALYRLRYVEERPYAEIACELDATVNHVGVLLSRLTRQLQRSTAAVNVPPQGRTNQGNTPRTGARVRTPGPGSSSGRK